MGVAGGRAHYGEQEETFGGIKTHGASVVIAYLWEVVGFMHLTSSAHTKPRVEVFPDGVRIGCTFVTGDAIRKIAKEYAQFEISRSKVIQDAPGGPCR